MDRASSPSLLRRLAPDQLAAAVAPPGPILCIAPAGSGKTTTLLARIGYRLAQGADPATVCALTFNRRAAEELRDRLAPLLEELGLPGDAVRVRTFHALGREILAQAGQPVEPLLDRARVLEELCGGEVDRTILRGLDDAISRLKLEVAADTDALRRALAAAATVGRPVDPLAGAFVAYEDALAAQGGLDHDDLLRRALALLDRDAGERDAWRRRCAVLVVDEVQDLDRSQWRLARLLAAPRDDVFLVGDDDQTIYAWRLADARRMLRLAEELPGLRRVHLEVNYRCPPEVVARAVRLVGHNRERFAKSVRAAPGAAGSLRLLADPGDDVARARRLLETWAPTLTGPAPVPRHAVLARTNAELAPYAGAALELGLPYGTEEDGLLLDEAELGELLERLSAAGSLPPLAATIALADSAPGAGRLTQALAAWAAGCRDAADLAARVRHACRQRDALRDPDAPLVLATAHGTKGLEFDVVACVGHDEGRFPSARSLREAADPARTLEEERRLAYVAWTRARRELLLVYDPGAPSLFLREAFEDEELACGRSREPTPAAGV